MNASYRGRFAPTPSGPLHFGSLITALASYLEAKRHGGQWLLRIDDIDPPRVQPGASDGILRTLERYGFTWDGPVIYQSRRLDAYHAALHYLKHKGLVYPCSCSRVDIARVASMGVDGPIYPGTCRYRLHHNARALRFNVEGETVQWTDAIQGDQCVNLARDFGDFVIYRADCVYSFHLASAVDDGELGITNIVRGADLLESSLRQGVVQRLLGWANPRYAHLPVAVNVSGKKLSKQSHAAPLSLDDPQSVICQALAFLGQQPPVHLIEASLRELWEWSLHHWNMDAVPRQRQRLADSASLANRTMSSGTVKSG